MQELQILALVTEGDVALFSFALLFVFLGLVAYFAHSYWKMHQRRDVSPYSGLPLRYASELTYINKERVLNYLRGLHDFDNRVIDLNRAALCRDTGRIFPNCIAWSGAIKLDWTFIAKRYKGNFVSWGSLSAEKKKEIREAHISLDGYQTEFSSQNPSPRYIEDEYALMKPGPLYVDPETNILLGWRIVPGTDLELLIVQKPKKITLININQ